MNIAKEKEEITQKLIDSALSSLVWDLGNDVLYSLCRDHPAHNQVGAIVAKMWLIGRAYAASIERRKNKDNISSDDFYENIVAKQMQNSKLDRWLGNVNNLSESIAVHKQLMDIFYHMTNLNKRSLASKYLHFHKPDMFFIYDSRANAAIKRITPNIKVIERIKVQKADEVYLKFCCRCLWLKNHIQEKYKKELTPRQIDKILLKYAEGNH